MKWSDALEHVRAVLANVDQYTDATHGTVQDALDKLRRMLDALDEDNDTELPS